MSDDKYRLAIGNYTCLIINDGIQPMLPKQLFNNIPEENLPELIKTYGKKRDMVKYPVSSLAIDADGDWVLIDVGQGEISGRESGYVIQTLEDEEIRPSHIILTHLHPEHYGGLTNKKHQQNFPYATVYICRDEWAVYTSADYLESHPKHAAQIKKHLLPAESQIERIECPSEVLPGFSIENFCGHTEYNAVVIIENGKDCLMVAGDILLYPQQVEYPEWGSPLDSDPEEAFRARCEFMEWAIEKNAIVHCSHFPFPGLGKIERNDDRYRWVPLEDS